MSQPDPAGSARPARPGLVTAAGLLVMVVAGIAASPYTPFWFDPDEGCRLLGRCPGPATDAALRAMWVLEWAGLAVVLLGLVLTWRKLRAAPAPPAPHPLPAWAEVGACALAGMVLSLVLGPFVLVGALVSGPAVPAALCVFWLVQACAVTALDRQVGPGYRTGLPCWLAGLGTSALAVTALVWSALEILGPIRALPVVDGAVLALGMLAWRAAAWRAGLVPAGARPWSAAGAAIAVLAVAAAVFLVVSDSRPANDPAPLPDLAAPGRPAPPEPAAPHPPAPTVDATVHAAVACGPDDLSWSTTGWDAAMGTRAVTVVATSHAAHPCYVDGFAGIAIAQGGRALRLTTEPGSATGTGVPAARRVGLAVGGAASFPLIWRGYGAAADQDTPQALTVVLAGAGEPRAVPLDPPPAPFDLIDGGTVRVGPWSPSPPP